MGLGYRLALRYRLGIDDLGAVVARLTSADHTERWEVGRTIDLLATGPGLTAKQLVALSTALAGRDIGALRWALVDAGQIDAARAMPVLSRQSLVNAIDRRMRAGVAVPPSIIADVAAMLDALDLDEDLRLAIQIVKSIGPSLTPARRTSLLEAVVPRARAAAHAGAWDELDYGYGAVDPSLELARALAHAGDEDGVDAALASRVHQSATFLNIEEIAEAHALVHARSPSRRAATWAHFRRWAGDELDGDSAPGWRVAWLVQSIDDPWVDAAAELSALVPQLGVYGLAAIATLSGRPVAAAAERAVVPRFEAAVVNSRVKDWNICARAIRDVAGAAPRLTAATSLTTEDEARVDAAARAWSAWFATYDTSDHCPFINAAIGLAPRWRDAIDAAATRLQALDPTELDGYEDWAPLFTPDQLLARLTM